MFVSDLIARGRWFSPGTRVSFTNTTDRHDNVKFLFFPRRDLNPPHCYTAAPFA